MPKPSTRSRAVSGPFYGSTGSECVGGLSIEQRTMGLLKSSASRWGHRTHPARRTAQVYERTSTDCSPSTSASMCRRLRRTTAAARPSRGFRSITAVCARGSANSSARGRRSGGTLEQMMRLSQMFVGASRTPGCRFWTASPLGTEYSASGMGGRTIWERVVRRESSWRSSSRREVNENEHAGCSLNRSAKLEILATRNTCGGWRRPSGLGAWTANRPLEPTDGFAARGSTLIR